MNIFTHDDMAKTLAIFQANGMDPKAVDIDQLDHSICEAIGVLSTIDNLKRENELLTKIISLVEDKCHMLERICEIYNQATEGGSETLME